ncbi:DoxX family protein [Halobacteriales archaeon QS_1_68_20]|nr:MAG: DoxX family protein [Halobacteriales archaeon QS_1_68_20]
MTAVTTALDRADAWIGRYAHHARAALRFALGVVILLAGAHKLVAPAAWHGYLAPLLADLWPTALLPLDPTFVLFGVSEVLFGVLLLADWHTPTVAALTALSLLGVVANLVVGVVQGQPHADVLVRDVGLPPFAFGVALDAARAGD